MARNAFLFVAILAISWRSPLLIAQEGSPSDFEFFERHIRPVLVRECYDCHSSEAESKGKLRGKLYLDTREGIRTGGESGPAIVPGNPSDSLLIHVIHHDDLEMPPKGKLPDDIIANFEKWIQEGAMDPRDGAAVRTARTIDHDAAKQFWAFQPLTQRSLPTVQHSEWVRSPVDQFILQKLESLQLIPNSLASPHALVRRAFLDLTGLPPTPEEHDDWVSRLSSPEQAGDINGTEWIALVDHLLDSPHYGERWARHWMDVARFAESFGYEQDYDRPNAYHYRDFLIRALNDDMPYDQFVRWQLAGDELAPEDPLAWMATGFLAAGVFPTQLTEAEFESTRYDELDDIVATTGVAFLGLSVGCARCHDHKFDPITSREYYQLIATFTETIRSEKLFDLEPVANAAARSFHSLKLAALRELIEREERHEIPPRLAQWLSDVDADRPPSDDWSVRKGTLTSSDATTFEQLADGSLLASGPAPDREEYTFRSSAEEDFQFAALRLEALCDDSLPHRGPGRADNGNFSLGNVELSVISSPAKNEAPVPFSTARATHQQDSESLSVAASIDNDPETGWAVDGQSGTHKLLSSFFPNPLRFKRAHPSKSLFPSIIRTPGIVLADCAFPHPPMPTPSRWSEGRNFSRMSGVRSSV
jgi:Protein of unknown function (DUF1549)/Planctomycete cytochrome C